jgi:hypothetical protein
LRIALAEKLAATACEKIFISETGAFLAHMGHFPLVAPRGAIQARTERRR